jgi:hypothetical protein
MIRRISGTALFGVDLASKVRVAPPDWSAAQREFMTWRFGMFVHSNLGTAADTEWAGGCEDPGLFHLDTLDCGQGHGRVHPAAAGRQTDQLRAGRSSLDRPTRERVYGRSVARDSRLRAVDRAPVRRHREQRRQSPGFRCPRLRVSVAASASARRQRRTRGSVR